MLKKITFYGKKKDSLAIHYFLFSYTKCKPAVLKGDFSPKV